MDTPLPRTITIEKYVGETPLQCLHRVRELYSIPEHIPLAYAGRLDPMASGTLLVLIGEECKQQARYHAYDKAYDFEILFGVSSDTGDVLGRITEDTSKVSINIENIRSNIKNISGHTLTLPYPHFSSKTVHGKPLHVWTLENRLNEITIPTYTAKIYSLHINDIRTVSRDEVYSYVQKKIETIPHVSEQSKALGADFRREYVRRDWHHIHTNGIHDRYVIATCQAIVSSGLYIRSLAPLIAKQCGTHGLAYSIHRTHIGTYLPLWSFGFWLKEF
jgi:tRNA pseudouridine(55) synthase